MRSYYVRLYYRERTVDHYVDLVEVARPPGKSKRSIANNCGSSGVRKTIGDQGGHKMI